MTPPPLKSRVIYKFDNAMARGTLPLLGWLAAWIAAFILVVSVVLMVAEGVSATRLPLLLWDSLIRILDPAGIIEDSRLHEGTTVFLAGMFVVSVAGIFVIAVLIGLVTTGMEERLRDLRRGRSRVVESGHVLILGWSRHAATIISELVLANANQPRSAIVILAERDPIELRDEITTQIGSTGRTRVICRRGDPTDLKDLETVSFATARSIIIVSAPAHDASDCLEVKTLLAITNHPRRGPQPFHIVLALNDADNAAVAKMVGGDEVEVVQHRDVIARIVAQTCRQPGLSVVHTELLQFRGDEIYFHHEPALAGKTFGEALFEYSTSSPIGLHPAGAPPMLNPPMDTVIGPDDEIIAISEDDDTVLLSKVRPSVDETLIRQARERSSAPERALILGWNRGVAAIVEQLDAYVAPGSAITLVAGSVGDDESWQRVVAGAHNQTVTHVAQDPASRTVLDSLDVPSYDHVIVCEADGGDAQEADAQALLTLLHLRDMKRGSKRGFSIVTEMSDARNRDLAAVAEADDFIVSENLVSLMLAQISEHKNLRAILDDIFDPEGSEIYLKPAADYVQTEVPLSFYTVVEAARRRNEVAIGYRICSAAKDPARGFGVVINPDKALPVTLSESDKVIVVAEE